MGFRDAVIPSTGNAEYDSRTLHSFLGYSAFSEATIREGEVFHDAVLPTFQAYAEADDRLPDDGPMFNPFGQWRLVPVDSQRNKANCLRLFDERLVTLRDGAEEERTTHSSDLVHQKNWRYANLLRTCAS